MTPTPGTLVYSRDHWGIRRYEAGMGEWEYYVFYKDACICTTDSQDKAELIAATFLLGPAGVRVLGDGGVGGVRG